MPITKAWKRLHAFSSRPLRVWIWCLLTLFVADTILRGAGNGNSVRAPAASTRTSTSVGSPYESEASPITGQAAWRALEPACAGSSHLLEWQRPSQFHPLAPTNNDGMPVFENSGNGSKLLRFLRNVLFCVVFGVFVCEE